MITKLEFENFMRIGALDWEPQAGMNVMRGKNKAGKTTIIRGLNALFGGADAAPPVPIKLGEEASKVVAETPEFTATRRWWRVAEGVKTELKVVAKEDGQVIKSPQKLFDKVFPPESNPTMFFKLKPAERVDWLLKVIGVDPTLLDRAIEKIYDARTLVNHELKAAEARFKATSVEKPPAAVDTAGLLKERGELTNAQQWERQTKAERDAAMRRYSDCEAHVRACEAALNAARTRLEEARKQAAQADNAVDEAESKAEGSAQRLTELDELLQKASAVATANAKWAEREKLEADVKRLAADSAAKTAEIERLKGDKDKMLEGVKFPIDGLGFGDGDVTFKGLPLEQASGAEQIRIGAAVLIAKHPRMKLFMVDEGSNLDEDNLAALDAFGQEHGVQTFLAAAGESGPATIVIRDGGIVEP